MAMDFGVLSQLAIVETGRVLPFEWRLRTDTSRDQTDRKSIHHPFPVLARADGTYLLLGDVDLFYDLADQQLPHLPVQICDASMVRLNGNRVGVTGFGYNDLVKLISRHPGGFDQNGNNGAGHADPLCLTFEFPHRAPITTHLKRVTETGCPPPIAIVFREIAQLGFWLPLSTQRLPGDGVFRTTAHSGIVTLPSFSLDDLVSAALSDHLFPPHLLLVQVAARVLNVDFPISVLGADISTEEKDLFLRDLIVIREQSYRTAYFEGQVYILNR